MRIAINARLLVGQSYTGVHLYVYNVLCELLRQLPNDDFLVITDRQGPLPALPRHVERVTVGPPARHPILFVAWFEWSLPRAAESWGADVLVSLENLGSLRTKVPQLLVVHDLAYLHQPEGVGALVRAYYRYFMPRFVHRADTLLTVSKATKQDVAAAYDVDPSKIQVAYNGVRPRFTRLSAKQVTSVRERLTEGQPYFVYVGSVHPRKNVDGLIRAYSRFRESSGQPHHLVIAGRFAWQAGPTRDALEASPFREDIHLLGYVEEEQLGEVIGAATALVLVSHFEGFGVPVVEAHTCGVPVIASNTSSLPEVTGPGGLLVDPADDEAIAGAMAKLATDDALRQVLAKAGEEHAKQFIWAAAGEVVVEALRELVLEN